MALPTVLFAGHEFPAAAQLLAAKLPELTIAVVERELPPMRGDVLIPLMARVDGAAMDRIEGLRLIQQWGAGLEGVDIAAATGRGIAVGNVVSTESGNADAVAEWCVMAALALGRKLGEVHSTIRSGTSWGAPIGRSLAGSTAGIVGFGGIGKALARRLRPFGVDVIAITTHPEPADATELGLSWLKDPSHLDELLVASDNLFLCLPLRPQSRHLIDERAINKMRAGSFLINPGRGALVDEAALIAALTSGQLGGAALDVFESEPLEVTSPLLGLPSVMATPHIAGVTDRSYEGNAACIVNGLRALQGSRPLDYCVNWTEVSERFYATD